MTKPKTSFKDFKPEINFGRGYTEKDFDQDCILGDKIIKMVPEDEREHVYRLWVHIINTKDSDAERARAWKATINPYFLDLSRVEKAKFTGLMIQIYGTKQFLSEIRKKLKR